MHRRTASKRFVSDGAVLGEIDQVRETLRVAKLTEISNSQGLASEVPRLERQLVELAEQAANEAVTFTVQALPGETFDEIKRQHPPTEEQLDRYRTQAKVVPWADMPEMNPATMGPELLVACLIEPDWTPEEVRGYWAELSKGQQNQLWNLALDVQTDGADLPFYAAATGTTVGGGEPSTTPANGESPSPSI